MPVPGFEQERVVVTTTDGRRVKGVLVCADRHILVLARRGAARQLHRDDVREVRTRRDPVWDGALAGLLAGAAVVLLGSYEADLRGATGRDAARFIIGVGAVGAALDAVQYEREHVVRLPDRRAAAVAYRITF